MRSALGRIDAESRGRHLPAVRPHQWAVCLVAERGLSPPPAEPAAVERALLRHAHGQQPGGPGGYDRTAGLRPEPGARTDRAGGRYSAALGLRPGDGMSPVVAGFLSGLTT